VIVHALVAVGVTVDGQREVLGLDVVSGEDGAGWLAFLRALVARGLSGVALAISDAHPGLVGAVEATLPGASWQRCRTHYASRPGNRRRRGGRAGSNRATSSHNESGTRASTTAGSVTEQAVCLQTRRSHSETSSKLAYV
jgi:hypothetical protein